MLYLYTDSQLSGGSEHQKLPKMSTEYWFNQNIIKSEAKNSTGTNVSFGTQIGRMFCLILADRMNLLLLTEPDPTDSL